MFGYSFKLNLFLVMTYVETKINLTGIYASS